MKPRGRVFLALLLSLSAVLVASAAAPAPAPEQKEPPLSPDPDYLTLSQALELAASYPFDAEMDCLSSPQLPSWVVNASFLGPVNKLRTADVLQAFYTFNATCAPGEAPAAQPPLLLLPPMEAAMAAWGAAFLRELQGALPCGRRVLVMEHRGAGQSVDYSQEALTYYTMADSVLELLDALNFTQPVDILGWSTGGDIALLLAALHAPRVGRVIGIGAEAGSNHTVLPDVLLSPAASANLSYTEQMAVLFPPQNQSFFEEVVCRYVASLASMPAFLQQVNDTVGEAQYAADLHFTTVDSTLWDRLPTVESPVLLLDGSLDVAVPPVNAELIAAELPDARVLFFNGWGHGLVVGEASSQLAAVVAGFLSGAEPAGSFVPWPPGAQPRPAAKQ